VIIKRAVTDADLAGWCEVWNAITPREPVGVDDVRRRLRREPERLYVVAETAGRIVGLGFAGPSQSPGRIALAVRVLTDHRRQGLGSALFDRVLAHAIELEPDWVSGMVSEGEESPASVIPGVDVVELREEHKDGDRVPRSAPRTSAQRPAVLHLAQ
jgi:GNAT superfamily N-acetyltransferase